MQPTTTSDRARLTVGGDELTIRVSAAESGGDLLAFEVRMPPGGGPPALHRHAPAELYRVEQGEFAFYIADAEGSISRSTAGPGDVVAIPGGREHTIRNESAAESVAFVVFSPGERFERFVRVAAESNDIAALATEHGIEMTRPLEEER
jgi:oxalate decarboxylase/phosphoglucose isomerase-like protein (cupin superfamily)